MLSVFHSYANVCNINYINVSQEKLSLIPLIQTNALLTIQQNRFVSLSLIPLKYLVIIELVSIVNNDN